ncbi:TPA: hypothetical protein ACOEP6_004732 [Enterobacter ludwigii]
MAKRNSTDEPVLPETPETPETPELIKMARDADHWPPPHTANVHPDEVRNYYPGGWLEVK